MTAVPLYARKIKINLGADATSTHKCGRIDAHIQSATRMISQFKLRCTHFKDQTISYYKESTDLTSATAEVVWTDSYYSDT